MLASLEYPRHLHKKHGAYCRVNTLAEAEAALAEGWCVHVPPDQEPAPVDAPAPAEPDPEPEPAPEPEPEPVAATVKARVKRASRHK